MKWNLELLHHVYLVLLLCLYQLNSCKNLVWVYYMLYTLAEHEDLAFDKEYTPRNFLPALTHQ